MNSDLEYKFLRTTANEIKNYETLKAIFTDLYKNEFQLFKKRKSAFEDMSKINESNIGLKKLYDDFIEKMKNLEDERNNQILKINSKFIPAFATYTSNARNFRSKIDFYKYKKQNKNKIGEDDLTDINKDYIPFDNIKDDIAYFEAKRLDNYRLIYLHYVYDKLMYHFKSIEQISELYREIREQLVVEKPIKEVNINETNNEDEEDNK